MHEYLARKAAVLDGALRDASPLPSSVRGFRGRPRSGRGDHGATSVEYAIMVSLIAVVIVSAVALFGQNMIQLFGVPSSAL